MPWPTIAMLCGVASSGCFDPSSGDDSDPTTSTGSSSGDTTLDDTASFTTSDTITTETVDSDTPTTMPDTSSSVDDTTSMDTGRECNPGEVLGCDENALVQCNANGTGEEQIPCSLGCFADELRCFDIDPSNDLGQYLDGARAEADLDLGVMAQIDTTDGTVTVDGAMVPVTSFLHEAAPPVRVLVVGSLIAQDVTVTGVPALAFVSDGDVQISGHLSLSAGQSDPGPGALNAGGCQGGAQVVDGDGGNTAAGGAGGGGFGSAGANGGNATAQTAFAVGGSGGGTTGAVTLIPLRGGCDAGVIGASLRGAGGGALQLVSRTSITIEGTISANGSSASGGGSGGGILLEAPQVEVMGNVVANGGAGAGGGFLPEPGEDGRLDALPAQGGPSEDSNLGEGGDGAAGNLAATMGASVNFMSGLGTDLNFAGHGGGGVGRIRVNTAPDAFIDTGLFSPNPTTGAVGTR